MKASFQNRRKSYLVCHQEPADEKNSETFTFQAPGTANTHREESDEDIGGHSIPSIGKSSANETQNLINDISFNL